MEDPDWAKVLNYLYEHERALGCKLVDCDNNTTILEESLEEQDIVAETGLSSSEILETIQFLVDQGLCEKENSVNTAPAKGSNTNFRRTTISITPDGFDVAHDREIAKSQQETNKRSARLSGYLVIGIIIQALASFSSISGALGKIIYGLVIIGLLFLVLVDLGIGPLDLRSS